VANCWEFMTEKEREWVKIHGCWDCTDCKIPYLEELPNPLPEASQSTTSELNTIM